MVDALIAQTDALILRIEMVARARCALKNKHARKALKTKQKQLTPPSRGGRSGRAV